LNILLAFAPFIAFAVIDRTVGITEGLVAGALVSAALLVRDRIGGKTPKVLEVGSALLFGGLALYTLLGRPAWSIVGVRLWVDAGLLAIVLASIAIRMPFTLQYARETVPRELWDKPGFVRTNTIITAAWAAAFAVLVAADLVMLYAPEVPQRYGIIATILAIVGAVRFTDWYRERARSAAAG